MGNRAVTAVAVAALVVACSGTSYAAAKIGTKDIKNNAVTSKKIKNGAVRLKDLAPGAKEPTVLRVARAAGVTNTQNQNIVVAARIPALAPGSYLLSAKYTVNNIHYQARAAHCTLRAGNEEDHAYEELPGPAEQFPVPWPRVATMSNLLTATFASRTDVTLECWHWTTVDDVVLVALPVDGIQLERPVALP